MCLILASDSAQWKKNLRRRAKPIKCYKTLKRGKLSPYQEFKYKLGINDSKRSNTRLTSTEIRDRRVYTGLHVYICNPQENLDPCQYLCPRRYRYRCPRRCPHRYPYPCRYFIWECEVDPKDIIAVGYSGLELCLIATKIKLVKSLGKLQKGK